MRPALLPRAMLRAASWMTPAADRAEWLREWHGELWYIPAPEAVDFCRGAFRDALWLRRNTAARFSGLSLESPAACLAFLALLAIAGLAAAACLPALKTVAGTPHMGSREIVDACRGILLLSCAYLMSLRIAMGHEAANPDRVPLPARVRLGVFFALKVILVQPIMLCSLMSAAVIPLAPLGLWAFWTLSYRWILSDQHRRCPVCLRLLTNPVRIGSPSRTFLEWYGAESMCARGHGLLQTPETTTSYAGHTEWLRLGDSWSRLFPDAVGVKQP